LSALGIVPEPSAGQGGILAHVTEGQLALLEAEGIAFEKLGRVTIISAQGDPGILGSEYGFNDTDVDIPDDMEDYEWVYSNIVISGAPAGATVTGVTYHVYAETNVNVSWCPAEAACGQIKLRIWKSGSYVPLDNTSVCCNIGSGPSIADDTSPEDLSLVTWTCYKSGIMHHGFDGRLVNGTWSLGSQNTCLYGNLAYIDLWYITVYYDDPTPTPTNTPTATPKPTRPPADKSQSGKWIEIDLSSQWLYAHEGQKTVLTAIVSTGTRWTPTVKGRFKVYAKYKATRMSGPGYSLPNVPWTMYFYGGYAIHGTYWHSNFGTPMSHGCVNMRTDQAKQLFNWAPKGTLVVVHQ